VYWKGLEPFELLKYDSHLVAESTLRCINPREPEDFDYSTLLQFASQHRRAVATTSTTRFTLQLQLLQQISSANDYLNYSSRLETSRGRVLNFSVTSFARSRTSRNQLRLVGFVDKLPTYQIYASPPTFYTTHTLSIGTPRTYVKLFGACIRGKQISHVLVWGHAGSLSPVFFASTKR
jgi:hypothetical protein